MTHFLSIDGTNRPLNAVNARLEGKLRALNTANAIRNADITIYSIGLGSGVDREFLKNVANDPTAQMYNPNQPIGEAVFAPTSADLERVFQEIAAKIMMRITM